jgi:hypothetical protein
MLISADIQVTAFKPMVQLYKTLLFKEQWTDITLLSLLFD